ncbi:hypothetical protein [Sulfuricurvum sp.]|uniref:hypothetical protein n=1 Tax=Sulfuricurvum sp. TaxID=2025608 RepID=UPI002617773E|nr:hypothetical protein [Sulfuricurvum sp.]MDD2267439.1 hypothetical protein [Sulfuricurvum sp.]MDD2782839.1 hypothetical protein [Sulfuricurvum sp.]
MSKVLSNAIGVSPNTDKAYDNNHAQSNVIKSVFHTILVPLGLSLGSPIAGLVYFILTIVAYSTIFRAESYYVFAIIKFVAALIALASAWISFLYSAAWIGHTL